MPWNGSGTFSLTEPPINFQASPISSADMNSKHADIVAGLNNTLPRDGQAAMTGSLPMGANKITGLGAATLLTDAARADQVQNGAFVWCGSAGGTANAITLSPSPAITSYVAGQTFRFVASANNTGATTVNISSLGTKAVKASNGALGANVIISGFHYEVTYDGTDFILNQRTKVADGDVANILDWNGADPTGSNDNDAILRAALAQSLAVFVPVGRWVLNGATPYEVKDGHAIFGANIGHGAAANIADGTSKLIMTGSATAGFTNADTATALLHASVTGLTIYSTGSYTWLFDFLTPVGVDMADLNIETNQNATGLIRHRKINTGDSCWVNNTRNLRLRVPDASTARTWDSAGSDEAHVGNNYTGGLGAIDRSSGAKYVGCRMDRTTQAGITISLEADGGGSGVGNGWKGHLIGNQIEVNSGYDILIDGDANDALTNTKIGAVILGNTFRNNTGSVSVYLKNATGSVLEDITITGNHWNVTGVTELSIDETRWKNVTRVGNTYRVKNRDRLNVGYEANANKTIASGAIQYTGGSRIFVGTQGGGAADDLDTITGGADGDIITLRTIVNTSRVVTVKNGIGNIVLSGSDAVLTLRSDAVTLEYNAADASWWEVSRAIA